LNRPCCRRPIRGKLLAKVGVYGVSLAAVETKILKVDNARPDPSVIAEAAALIEKGGLVGIPTETVYGIACRVQGRSLRRLNRVKHRESEKYYTLHIAEPEQVERYVPVIGLRARKLIRRGWPGPLTIVFELNRQQIERQRAVVGRSLFEHLYKDGSIGVRCPDHGVASALLRAVRQPVVVPSANVSGRVPATTAGEVLERFSALIELVLDAGPCRYGRCSTVVKVGGRRPEVLREGVYSAAEIRSMAQVQVLFVCTGNTCRSPMAEGVFRKFTAEKLNCSVDELGQMGYKILSAGIMDMPGFQASPEAVAACAARGIDISTHRSRKLTRQLVDGSDLIFAMSRIHCERIFALRPGAKAKCRLLAAGRVVPDPIGQGQKTYERCLDLIEESAAMRIGELVL